MEVPPPPYMNAKIYLSVKTDRVEAGVTYIVPGLMCSGIVVVSTFLIYVIWESSVRYKNPKL